MSPSPVTPYLGQAHWIKYGINSHRPEEVTFNEEKRYFFLVYKYHRCVCVCVCVVVMATLRLTAFKNN